MGWPSCFSEHSSSLGNSMALLSPPTESMGCSHFMLKSERGIIAEQGLGEDLIFWPMEVEFQVSFTPSLLAQVWQKGKIAPNNDPAVWRQDECGAWINWASYGNRESPWGWEVHHLVPLSRGGSDAVSNLIPLHYANNLATADGPLKCVVRSDGIKNIRVE